MCVQILDKITSEIAKNLLKLNNFCCRYVVCDGVADSLQD